MSVAKPRTKDEMVEQMWYALIGTNGDGLIQITKDIRKSMITKATCTNIRKANESPTTKKHRKQDYFFMVFGGALLFLQVVDVPQFLKNLGDILGGVIR